MVAIMALMESPAIIVGLLLLTLSKEVDSKELAIKKRTVLKHAFTNGSVLCYSYWEVYVLALWPMQNKQRV